MHMAETWGEVDWSTSPTASLTMWDENISLALQDRELNHILGDDLVVPAPETLPMPFTTAVDVEGESQGVADQNSGEERNMGSAADWWEAVRDKRVLRGRGDLARQASSSSSTSSALPERPLCGYGDLAYQGSSSSSSPLVPPASSCSSNSSGLLDHVERLSGETTHHASSSSSSTLTPSEPAGMTTRFGRTREGVDRWHHPDGSVRCRPRERLAKERGEQPHVEAGDGGETRPVEIEGWTQHVDGPTENTVTFYKEKFQVHASDNLNTGDLGADSSTTAGDNSSGTVADNEEGSSSSSNSSWSPGFYKHGEWQARSRTPHEQRLHTGGRGQVRTKKRQERMESYFKGEWRPAWLVQYRRERDARRAALLPQVQEEETPELVETAEEASLVEDTAQEEGLTTSPSLQPENTTWNRDNWESTRWDSTWNETWSGWSSSTNATSSWSWQKDWREEDHANAWDGVTNWATGTQATPTSSAWSWEEWPWAEWSSGSASSTSISSTSSTSKSWASWTRSKTTTSTSTKSPWAGNGAMFQTVIYTNTTLPVDHLSGRMGRVGKRCLGTLSYTVIPWTCYRGTMSSRGSSKYLHDFQPVVEEMNLDIVQAEAFPQAWVSNNWDLTLTSSTTSTTHGDVPPPNYGLFPEVRPARLRLDGDETGLMRITNGEIAFLQESGASRSHIRRVTDLLETLDAEQVQGRGAESRWSLARLLQRVTDGQEIIEATVRVLNRRLRPRGVLPVQRVPRLETERWRSFMWGRQFAGIFRDCLEANVMTPLQPGESEGVVGASGSSSGNSPVQHSPSSTNRARARSRSRGRSFSSFDDPDCDSEFAAGSDGELVQVPDAEPSPSNGPPPPAPVNFVSLEPVGIWRSPREDDEEVTNDAGPSPTPTTTSTSTTMSSLLPVPSWTMAWTHAPCAFGLGDIGGEVMEISVANQTTWVTVPVLNAWDETWGEVSTTTTTSTSSSSSTLGLVWPSDIVRDMVNVNLIHGGMTDTVQLIRMLLARQRRLHHMDRLLGDAIEEALTWLQVPLGSEALNAATYEARIWQTVTLEAVFGSGPTTTTPTQATTAQSVLLQPDFPQTVDELRHMLPEVDDHTLQGYRRRAWRVATAHLFREAGSDPLGNSGRSAEDTDLLIVQRREEDRIANWPDGVERPAHPVRDLPGRHAGPGRRRQRVPRPRPRWESVGRRRRRRLQEQSRERSRSRDS